MAKHSDDGPDDGSDDGTASGQAGAVPAWVGTLGIMLCGLGLFTVLAQLKFSYSPLAGLAMLGIGVLAVGAPRILRTLRR